MKKIIASLVLIAASNAAYATEYTCVAYIDNKEVEEPLKVNASKAAVAESKAYSRLKKRGITVDYVQCK